MRVRATLDARGQVEIRPATFLGDVYFAAYRAVCSGTKYDRKAKAQVTSQKRWPALREKFQGSGFEVFEDAALAKLAVATGRVPPDPELEARIAEVAARVGLAPYDYQREGVVFLGTRRGALLADEQGLGKTYQSCLAIPRGISVLCVAPAVGRGVWRDAVSGPPGQPERAFRPDFEVVTAKEVGGLPVPRPGRFAFATYEDITGAFRTTLSARLEKMAWRARMCGVGPQSTAPPVDPDHLPEVRIFAAKDSKSVVLVLPTGETLPATWDVEAQAWTVRLLVDKETPDGTYESVVRITRHDDSVEVQKSSLEVTSQSTPPLRAPVSQCMLRRPLPELLKKKPSALQLLAKPSLRLRVGCEARHPMVPRIKQTCATRFSRCPPFERKAPAYDLVIADEAHYLKNPKSQRNKAFRALSDAAGRVWLLTGTPLPSTPPELWAVLDAANLAEQAFGSFDDFCRLFGAEEKAIEVWDRDKNERKIKKYLEWPKDRTLEIEDHLSEEAARALAGVMLRRTKKQKLDLPDKVYRTVSVDVPRGVDKLLEEARLKIREDLGVDLAEDQDVDEKIPFFAIASVRAEVALAKVPAMIARLELHEEAGEKVLVFSSHLEPLRAAGARKGWASITGETPPAERREAERAFQAGELHGLACSIRAAGTALTLHRATVEVFVDRDWVPANNAQAEDRAHRIGTDHVVTVEDLVSDHPIDRHVTEVLVRKSRLISATFSLVER